MLGWKIADGSDISLAWSYRVHCDFESCEFHDVGAENEFLRVQGDPIVSAFVQPVDGLEKTTGEVIGPEQRVVDTLGFVPDLRHDLVESINQLINQSIYLNTV